MAERRRRSGYLRDQISRLLRADRTVTAIALREMLARQGDAIALNQIFRALGHLIDQGVACKVLVARGYGLAPRSGTITLFCRTCGCLRETAGDRLFGEIDAAATAYRFTPYRRFVEVAGTCATCANSNVSSWLGGPGAPCPPVAIS